MYTAKPKTLDYCVICEEIINALVDGEYCEKCANDYYCYSLEEMEEM